MPSMKPPAGPSRPNGPDKNSAFTKASLLWELSGDELPKFPLPSDVKATLANHPGEMPTSLSHWIKIIEFEGRKARRAAREPGDSSNGTKSRRVAPAKAHVAGAPSPFPTAEEARLLLRQCEFFDKRVKKGLVSPMNAIATFFETNRVARFATGAEIAGDVTTALALREWCRHQQAIADTRQRQGMPPDEPGEGAGAARGEVLRQDLASEYFRHISDDVWWVVGSGAAYGDGIETNPKLERVLTALKGAGIRVSERSLGFPGSCDSFTFSAKFSGGRLEITTGNYFGQRGGSVHGAHALKRLIKLMGLRVPARTAKLWNLHQLKGLHASSAQD